MTFIRITNVNIFLWMHAQHFFKRLLRQPYFPNEQGPNYFQSLGISLRVSCLSFMDVIIDFCKVNSFVALLRLRQQPRYLSFIYDHDEIIQSLPNFSPPRSVPFFSFIHSFHYYSPHRSTLKRAPVLWAVVALAWLAGLLARERKRPAGRKGLVRSLSW